MRVRVNAMERMSENEKGVLGKLPPGLNRYSQNEAEVACVELCRVQDPSL